MDNLRVFLIAVGKNLLVLAIYWLISYVLVQGAQRISFTPDSCQIVAVIISLILALKLHARPAAFLLGVFTAYCATGIAVHAFYGIHAAQGGPAQVAILLASFLGITLGAVLVSKTRTPTFVTPQ